MDQMVQSKQFRFVAAPVKLPDINKNENIGVAHFNLNQIPDPANDYSFVNS